MGPRDDARGGDAHRRRGPGLPPEALARTAARAPHGRRVPGAFAHEQPARQPQLVPAPFAHQGARTGSPARPIGDTGLRGRGRRLEFPPTRALIRRAWAPAEWTAARAWPSGRPAPAYSTATRGAWPPGAARPSGTVTARRRRAAPSA